MSNETIERFDYDKTCIGNIGPRKDGEYVRYSDHERIVKELEAQLEEETDLASLIIEANKHAAMVQVGEMMQREADQGKVPGS